MTQEQLVKPAVMNSESDIMLDMDFSSIMSTLLHETRKVVGTCSSCLK